MPTIYDVLAALEQKQLQRILAFGSSNTERFLPGSHWFDCLDLALRGRFGRFHRCINTGISGNTSTQLLQRFEQDAAFYQPHAVIITIGGNDANPNRQMTPQQFRENMLTLHQRFADMGTAVVLQTYYAPDRCSCTTPQQHVYLDRFHAFMDIVREIAQATGSHLIDHLARWEPFRQRYPVHYIQLMRDMMHLNPLGNLVMGLDLARALDLPLGDGDPQTWAFAKQCQKLLDASASSLAV